MGVTESTLAEHNIYLQKDCIPMEGIQILHLASYIFILITRTSLNIILIEKNNIRNNF